MFAVDATAMFFSSSSFLFIFLSLFFLRLSVALKHFYKRLYIVIDLVFMSHKWSWRRRRSGSDFENMVSPYHVVVVVTTGRRKDPVVL